MLKRPFGWILIIYIVVGIVVAWSRGYLHISLLRSVASALLAIFLWWLPLLGINLHIR